jgi:hypothetical protein
MAAGGGKDRAEQRARRKQERAERRARAFEARVAEAAAKDAARKQAAEEEAAARARERAQQRAKAAAELAIGPVMFGTLRVTVHKGTVYRNDRPLGPLAGAQAVCGPEKVAKERYQGATLAVAVVWSGITDREVRRMTVTVTVGRHPSTVTVKGPMLIRAARREAEKFNLLAESAAP